MAEKPDTRKYLIELTLRAMKEEEKLKELPKQDYYQTGSKYFVRLERRNESLNKAVTVLNEELGYHLQKLRIHQKDAKAIYKAIASAIYEKQEKKEAK